MRTAQALLVGLLLLASYQPAAADIGSLSAGVQGRTGSGDEDRFAEDSWGEDSGAFVESLLWEPQLEKNRFKLDFAFTTGRSGWLDLSVAGGRWRGGLRTTIHTSWSDRSFAAEFLPSGTPVSVLYPGTVDLAPFYGVDQPSSERIWAEGFVTRLFGSADELTLRFRAYDRRGERVPSIGGYSFSDVGTVATYTAGLEEFDSTSLSAALESLFHIGSSGVLRAEGGYRQRDDLRSLRLPTWGADALLGLNAWEDGLNVDEAWARLGYAHAWESWSLTASLAYVAINNSPTGGDREENPDGTVIRDGLDIVSGNVDRSIVSGAIGARWRAGSRLRVGLAADAQRRDGDGANELTLVGSPAGTASSKLEETSIGFTADVRAGLGPGLLRFNGRVSSLDKDIEETVSSFLQVVNRRRDRSRGRLRYTHPFGKTRLSVWGGYGRDDVTVDVTQLFNGYVTGDWSSSRIDAGAAVSYRAGPFKATVRLTGSNDDLDMAPPFFDPVFDPSQRLFPVSGEEELRRASGSLLWAGSRGDAWVDLGWLEAQFSYPESGVQPSFALVSEKVRGSVVAAGGRVSVWKGGMLAAQLEYVDNGLDLDRQLARGRVEIEQSLREKLKVFGRWSVWDYAAALAPSDEYTYHLLLAGVRIGW